MGALGKCVDLQGWISQLLSHDPPNTPGRTSSWIERKRRQKCSVNELELHCVGAQETPSATSAPTRHFVPSSQRNATYDAFFHHEGRCIGFQMTLSETHSLNPDGLKDLYDRLQYPYEQPTQHWFVVVIRKGCQFKKFDPHLHTTRKVPLLQTGA